MGPCTLLFTRHCKIYKTLIMEYMICFDTQSGRYLLKSRCLTYINVSIFYLLALCGLVHGQGYPEMFKSKDLNFRGKNEHPKPGDIACVPSCICTGGEYNISVDCSHRNLIAVPTKMGGFTTSLDLSHNNISFIPGHMFHKLNMIEHLNLGFNRLQVIPENLFSTFIHLDTLNLQYNQIQKLSPETFKSLNQLRQLHLDGNNLGTIPDGCFRNLHQLTLLWLNNSGLTELPSSALRDATALKALTLADNSITAIPNHAFENCKNLTILLLYNNQIERIGEHSFSGLANLTHLQLDRNLLSEVPPGLSQLPNLQKLLLSDNRIPYIPNKSFVNNSKLSSLHLNNNPLESFGSEAFSHLPALQNLVLSEARQQTIFPDLTGNVNLTFLALDRGQINKIPANLCEQVPNLSRFDIHSNQLVSIPKMKGCKHLKTMNLKHNQIQSVGGGLFEELHALIDLTLSDNHIEEIPEGAFVGLSALNSLNLQDNHIVKIHPKAFAPLTNLEELNLGNNVFPELPTEGLQRIRRLETYNNYQLEDFPSREHFPRVETLVLSWAYHCCEYVQDQEDSEQKEESANETVDLIDITDWHPNTSDYVHIANTSSGLQVLAKDLWEDYDVNADMLNFSGEDHYYSDVNIVYNKRQVTCRPLPGPFWPCNDLMGWWFIRCGMWVVFLLALLGNCIVLVVSIVGRNKKDVPRFLICNLACADLLMGVYLGFLAVVDASSFGEFKKYAIKWQTSGWCQMAGFLGVLSSELSVYTLTIITMERYYAITHAVHINKRLSLKQSTYIMACGWMFSLMMAVLPLTGISDYRKFAVCLPFETSDGVSLGYVAFLMLMNMIAFLLIVVCYSRMYWAIRGSSAWNSNDSRVAKRMAILIFTDFFCWAPISFFGLTAAFGHHLVSLEDAKIFTVFVLPLNSCANPFLYAILTKQFKKDCSAVCKRFEEFTIHRNLNRLSQRNTVTWGSSRRPSALNSFFDKRDSVSRHSVSGASGHQQVSRSNSVISSIRNFLGRSNTRESRRSCNHIRGEDLMEALGPHLMATTCANPVVESGEIVPAFDSTHDICLCRSNAEIHEQDFNSNSDSSTGGTCIAHFFRKSKSDGNSSRHRKLAHSVSCPSNKSTRNDLSVLQLVPLKHSPGGVRKQSGGVDCPCGNNVQRKPVLTETYSAGVESVRTTTTTETDLTFVSTCLEDINDNVPHDGLKENTARNESRKSSKDLMNGRKVGDIHFKDKARLLGLNEADIIDISPSQPNIQTNPANALEQDAETASPSNGKAKQTKDISHIGIPKSSQRDCDIQQGNRKNCDTGEDSKTKPIHNSHLINADVPRYPVIAKLETSSSKKDLSNTLGHGSSEKHVNGPPKESDRILSDHESISNRAIQQRTNTKKGSLDHALSSAEMEELLEK